MCECCSPTVLCCHRSRIPPSPAALAVPSSPAPCRGGSAAGRAAPPPRSSGGSRAAPRGLGGAGGCSGRATGDRGPPSPGRRDVVSGKHGVGGRGGEGVLESPEAAFISQNYVEMLKFLDRYEDQTYYEWKVEVDEICQFNLDQPLIKCNAENSLLSVNFDPSSGFIREVKCLLMLNQSNIPHSALAIYNKRKNFAKCIRNLELVQLYNRLMQTTLVVEYPLIGKELRAIDDQLTEAEEICAWQVTTCWDCIKQGSLKLFKGDSSSASWKIYIEYIDDIVVNFVKQYVELQREMAEGDYGVLVEITGHLLAVKEGQTTVDELSEPLKEVVALLESYGQKMPGEVYAQLESSIDDWTKTQWREINVEQMDVELRRFAKVIVEDTTLIDLLGLQLHKVEGEVQSVVDNTVKELGTEKLLAEISQTWAIMEFSYKEHHRKGGPLLKSDERLLETCSAAIHVKDWQNKLNMANSVIIIWMEVQCMWSHQESIFTGCEDIRSQLPEDANRSDEINSKCKHTSLKSLAKYLETKHTAFPRFYFVSSADLRDILSKGTRPKQVAHHLTKLFDKIADLKFQENIEESVNDAVGICTVRLRIMEAILAYEEKQREQWGFDHPAQVARTGSQIWWVSDVEMAFSRLDEGLASALKDCHRKQVTQLSALITVLLGEFALGKIMTICTVDGHARDIASLVAQDIASSRAFAWLSQLCHRWDDTQKHCFANICNAQFQYFYEYLGNTPRLVITPLTDGCYITLTQCLHLTMSGDPVGPASTGKTETTKDLGHALGVMVYVFSCSKQMDYKLRWNIYKGLVQTGAWGCFDEFNRISVEVLSVVAVQVKTIHNAIRNKKKNDLFLPCLNTNMCIWIMGFGFVLIPCVMVVPDIELISEILLAAEEFIDACLLARKFITLYTLCGELLSKQDHYDWKICAIKSVLVVPGSLKRGDKNRPENRVLMRALRDFYLPKTVTDDIPIFMGLISDLFPALDIPRKRNLQFEQMVKQSTLELLLQPEERFILKVFQLEELLAVYHVLVTGNAGTGKSKALKVLHHTMNTEQKPVLNDLNPKVLIADELFSFIHGLLSSLLREQANITHEEPKWLVLDGDIDTMCIESLNTVMDDYKKPLGKPVTLSTWLLLEVHHLKPVTPATISRAVILYLNTQDLGWNPYFASWIEIRRDQSKKANLTVLFDKHVCPCLEQLKTRFKTVTPISENSMVQTVCSLLDCLLTPENVPVECPRELCEMYFLFACIWAFGGVLSQDQAIFVHTSETASLKYFIYLLLTKGKPVMLVGNARVGKTVFAGDRLSALFEMFEKLEKKAGHNGNKKLTHFIDGLNMPEVNRYRTVQLHSLIPQHIDYGHCYIFFLKYDRQKLTIKEIHNCRYIACMNPTAGSFTINPKLQRHFAVFALNFHSSGNKKEEESIKQALRNKKKLRNFANEVVEVYVTLLGFFVIRCQISCILEDPRGYALLIGVGGSGKQSFSRLAAYICSLGAFQTTLKKDYRMQDLKADLASLYIKPGAKNMPTVFLLTDAQVPDERFLVLINGLLASGDAPDLFSNEDMGIVTGGRKEVTLGLMDTRESCWRFFLSRVQLRLKIVCFSLGSATLARARKFPAIVNCTAIDWFREWPQEALRSINRRFIEEAEGVETHTKYMESSGNEAEGSEGVYRGAWGCCLQGTPQALPLAGACAGRGGGGHPPAAGGRPAAALQWLRLRAALRRRAGASYRAAGELHSSRNSICDFMAYAHTSVNMLSAKYTRNEVYNYTTPKSFLEQIMLKILLEKKSKEKSGHMEHLVNGMQKLKAAAFQVEDVKSKLASQEAELQLRNQDAEALIAKIGFQTEKVSQEKAIADAEEEKVAAIQGEVYMRQKEALINYDKEPIPQNCVKVVKEHYLKDRDFNPNYVHAKSFALADLCAVINMVKFNEVYCEVEQRCALTQASTELAAATEKLEAIRKNLLVLDSNLHKLTTSLQKAVAEKVRCQEHVNRTNKTIELVNRLVKGLETPGTATVGLTLQTSKAFGRSGKDNGLCPQSENMHWSQSIEHLKAQKNLCVLLTAAFLSYFGPFKQYRQERMEHFWIHFLKSEKVPIPVTEGLDLIATLRDDAAIVAWSSEGLPSDRLSKENATILTNCEHWPLMIGSQQQGTIWIKSKYGADLKVVLGQKGYIKIEDKECEFNKNFHVILHTKLASPHYKPELQAQATQLISVTRVRLEDQLLTEVVGAERLDLEESKSVLAKQQNCFKTELKQLEDDAAAQPVSCPGSFLDNSELAEKLKSTKSTAAGIQHKTAIRDRQTSILYFVSNSLHNINPIYQFSLKKLSGAGSRYAESTKMDSAKSCEESSPATPVFFILYPGLDPLEDTETLGKTQFPIDSGRFHNIALGQGQELVAEEAFEEAARDDHWVLLQNIHLIAKWLGALQNLLKQCSEESHPDFHVLISAEPAPTPQEHIIPQGILENLIKNASAPTGILANLHAALYSFDQDTLELCTREREFKSILFSLCCFHTCVAGRLKFGPQGWNRRYPLSAREFTVCAHVLCNYLETHMKLEGELTLAPGFLAPPNLDYAGYHKHIDEMLLSESPVLHGLHLSAEMGYLTTTSDNVFKTLLEMQPMNTFVGERDQVSLQKKVKNVLDDILEMLPEEFNMAEITQTTAWSPYALVCLQESERMNLLLSEIHRSLKTAGPQSEDDMPFIVLQTKGKLICSPHMEVLQSTLFCAAVPDTWTKLAYPSTYSLAHWVTNLLMQYGELEIWTQDLVLPAVVWLSGLFNPQSFLTAVMQSMTHKNKWLLIKMCLTVDVTKKTKEDYDHSPREEPVSVGFSQKKVVSSKLTDLKNSEFFIS
ncbi:LOW QUALITY PROTEIN: dynein axonemal heavy chain 11 [Aegotheles albertisi]